MTLCIAGAEKLSEEDSQFIICLKNGVTLCGYFREKVFSSLFHWEGKVKKNFYDFGSVFYVSVLDQVWKLVNHSDGCALSLGRHCSTYDQRKVKNSKLICCVYSLGRINKTDFPKVWHTHFTLWLDSTSRPGLKNFVLFFHWEGKTLNKGKILEISISDDIY